MKPRRPGPLAVPGLILAAGVLSACASADLAGRSASALDADIRSRGLDPQAILKPFAVNDEMRAWLRGAVDRGGDASTRLQGLVRSLLAANELHLEYESEALGTAAQAFESRRANCLAFTNLFVAMARALGLEAYFLEVDDVERFAKEGDLVVVSGHVTAGYGPPAQRVILDFTPGEPKAYRDMRQLSDVTAVALYYSNQGAQLLRGNDAAAAREWLETAVRLDPELSGGWVNLGVARRRTGDPVGAEAAYVRALEADPGATSAYLNLAALLRLTGRSAQAEELLAITDRRDNRNPYNYLELGDLSLRRGRIEDAERFFRRALRLDRESAEPYAALGFLSLARHDATEARRWLKRAQQRDRAAPRVERLERALDELRRPATAVSATAIAPIGVTRTAT
jgi:Flp pilus assembly protein TadD